jgi:hypothetical protein
MFPPPESFDNGWEENLMAELCYTAQIVFLAAKKTI